MAKPIIHPGDGGKGEEFYKEFLKLLTKSKLPFIIGGTYALSFYTGITRPTKDIDIFCKAGDYPKILKKFQDHGYKVEITDDRWLAKIHKDKFFVDLIFGSVPGLWPITNEWIDTAPTGEVLGQKVKITPPEELIVSKAYRMGRNRYDGADVAHIFLKCGKNIDWKRLLNHMEPYWEILLVHLLLFRFIYPSDRLIIPKAIMKELMHRLKTQLELPTPKEKISRGSLLSHGQYSIDFEEWGYRDFTQFVPVDK